MIEDYRKGIKAFNKDKTCRGFKFEAGKVYESDGKLELCENGFHFCPYIACTLEYYPNLNDNIYAEVEALGEILYQQPTKLKAVTNKIKIVRFLSEKEVDKLFYKNWNTGNSNTGDRNTGHFNTGNSNIGNKNTGHRNTGHKNTGNSNTGYSNAGDSNTGDWNTGEGNKGNSNTGDNNTGEWNTGYWNTGHRNTGHKNTGNSNTGDSNTGYLNTGDWNTGHRNTGNNNTGNSNTGYWNTGDLNTGDWNTGHRNTGFFNTNTPETIRVFNSEIDISVWEGCIKPKFIYFDLDEQLGYKGSFIKSYEDAPLKDKLKIFNIPNFDKKLFFEISGIDVTELEAYIK